MGTHHVWTLAALRPTSNSASATDPALEHLREQQAALDSLGIDDVDLSPVPELVEILIRRGDRAGAAAIATAHAAQAAAKGQPWPRAPAARCSGLLATDDELDARFAEALELHERMTDSSRRRELHLAYGARLRRARRVRAREELRTALDIFERLGATPWIDQATAELGATGETARRRDVTTLDQLTPQELQVAVLLSKAWAKRRAVLPPSCSARKPSNTTSGHVYQKLGIRSRKPS